MAELNRVPIVIYLETKRTHYRILSVTTARTKNLNRRLAMLSQYGQFVLECSGRNIECPSLKDAYISARFAAEDERMPPLSIREREEIADAMIRVWQRFKNAPLVPSPSVVSSGEGDAG